MLGYLLKRQLLKPLKKGVARGTWSVYQPNSIEIIDEIAKLRDDKIPWTIVDAHVRQIAADYLSALVSPFIQDSILVRFCNTPPHSVWGERLRAAGLCGDRRGRVLSWPRREIEFVSERLHSNEDRRFVKASYALAGVLEPEADDVESYWATADARFHRELSAWLSRVVRGEGDPSDAGGMIDLSTCHDDMVGTRKTFTDFVHRRLARIAFEAATERERAHLDELWPALLRRRFSQCERCGLFQVRLDRRQRRFCSTKCRVMHHNDGRSTHPQPDVRYGMEGYVPPVAALGKPQRRASRMAQLGITPQEIDLFKDVFAPVRTTYAKKRLFPAEGTEGEWHRAIRREAKTGERVPLELKIPDLLRHLLGQDLILGVLPSWSEGDGALMTYKIVLDIDTGGSPEAEPPFERLARIDKAMRTPDLVFISSASGGLHAYWFIDQTPVDKARAVVLDRLHAVGEEERSGHIEVYPSASGKQILRLPMGKGGHLVDWEGNWGPAAKESWRQLHIVIDVLEELDVDLPSLDDRFGKAVSPAVRYDSGPATDVAPVRAAPSPKTHPGTRDDRGADDGLLAAEHYLEHGIPHEGLRNWICTKRMFFYFARTSSSLEEAQSRGIEWIGQQARTSVLVRSRPGRAAAYMAYGIARTWTWWQKEQANSTQPSLRGHPGYPSPETIRVVLRLGMGLQVRRDAKGRALLGMLALLFNLAKRGHVRNEGMPASTPATLSTKYFLTLPGMTSNPRRGTYYLRILEKLQDAGLVARGDEYVRPETRPGVRRSTLCAGEPPRGKELLGTFDTVEAPPDMVALAEAEIGEEQLHGLGIAEELEALVIAKESTSPENAET